MMHIEVGCELSYKSCIYVYFELALYGYEDLFFLIALSFEIDVCGIATLFANFGFNGAAGGILLMY